MSLEFLTRPIGGSKTTEPDRPTGRGRKGGPHPEDVHRPGTLVVGGSPRADLMPPEIRIKRSQLRTRRSLRLGLVGVAAVVIVACGATVAWASLAKVGLDGAQSQVSVLLREQAQYADVKNATESIQLIQAGQRVASATEIDWNGYLGKVAGLLPAGVTIDEADLDQATPVEPYTENLVPLQGDRVATLTVVTRSATIPPVAQILAAMQTLPGFVDVTPSDVVLDPSTNVYKATITMHLDDKAFDGRFSSPGATNGANR